MFCTRASSRSNPEACGMRSSTMPANTSRRPVEFPIYCEQDRVPTFVTARLAVGASHALERDQPRAILAACRRGERSVRVRTVRRRQLRRPPTRGRRLKAWLYHQLRRRFSQQNRDRLKAELFRLRRALRGLYRFRYGTFSAVELRSELAARLPSDFGEGTPFGIMARRKTVIAGIATHYFRVLTQVHAAEDLLGESFPSKWRQRRMNVDLIDAKGGTTPYRLAIPIDKPPTKIEGLRRLLDRESLREWRY